MGPKRPAGAASSSDKKKKDKNEAEPVVNKVLSFHELRWRVISFEALPEKTIKGVLTFLLLKENVAVNNAMMNKKLRKVFLKAHIGLTIPAVSQYRFTNRVNFKVLRWVLKLKTKPTACLLSIVKEEELRENGYYDHRENVAGWLIARKFFDLASIYISTNPNVKDSAFGLTSVLGMAASAGLLDIVNVLLHRGADINRANEIDRSFPLLAAATNGHLEVTRALINAGANVNRTDKFGWSPLTWACNNNHEAVVRLLLDSEAGPNLANTHGSTPAMCAAYTGNLQILTMLKEAGADLDQSNRNGESPMLVTARAGLHRSVRALVKHGANPEKSDFSGNSPLMWAALKATPSNLDLFRETIAALLEVGADPKRMNHRGQSAMDVCEEPSVMKQLEEANKAAKKASRSRK
jgi:ankyrin repeat protein